jgi:DNA modification methylase
MSQKHSVGLGTTTAEAEIAWTNIPGPPVMGVNHQWFGFNRASERDTPRTHPTQKPIALMMFLIDLYTKPGQLVFDPYAGAGSTLLAARRLGRRSIGIEMSDQYCTTILERLAYEDEHFDDDRHWDNPGQRHPRYHHP